MGMNAAYDVPAGEATAEIVEKKSRFIAHLIRISSEEEAASFLREEKKKYWDARHHCSAFVLGPGCELTRCSDDGEPSGTAGRPMLDVLLGSGLHDTAAVVTRYFGGVLLGTGGLVRAYSAALQAAVARTARIHVCYGRPFEITAEYTDYGKVEHLLRSSQIEPDETGYGEKVTVHLMVPEDACEKLRKDLTEGTNARARIRIGDPRWYER